MMLKEKIKKAIYTTIEIDGQSFAQIPLSGDEYYLADNQGYDLYVHKVSINFNLLLKDLGGYIGKSIKFIRKDRNPNWGFYSVIKRVEKTDNSVTFYLDTSEYKLLLNENTILR